MAAEPDLIAGTITLTNGSDEFTGVGTSWLLSGGRAGDMIIDLPGTPYQGVVKEITSDTAGLLTKPWDGPTLTSAYRYRFQPDGSRVPAEARNLIELLGNGNLQAAADLTGSANQVIMFTGPGAMTTISKAELTSGANYDVQVADQDARDAYDGQAEGFSVLISDMGDGRSAITSRVTATTGVWSDPAYVTGPIGETPDVTIGTVTTGAPGTDAEVTATPTVDGVELDFVIPAGEGFAFVPGGYNSGTAYALGDVVRDAGSSWIALQPTTGNAPPTLPTTSNAYWELMAQKGQDGEIDGVTPFWQGRILVDADAAEARVGLGAVGGPASSAAKRLAVFADVTGDLLDEASGLTPAQQGHARADIGADVLAGLRNPIINGNFDIWQLATSQTASGYASDDRWANLFVGGSLNNSQQTFTLGQTDVPGNPKYFSRSVVTHAVGADNFHTKQQRIEGVQTYSGEKATITFYAKADAAKNVAVELRQIFGTGGSPSAPVSIPLGLKGLTTAWQKFSVIVDVPSIAGKVLGNNGDDCLLFALWFEGGSNLNSFTSSLGQQSGTFDIAHVSIVKGDASAEVDPAPARPLALEWELCRRYLEVISLALNTFIATGQAVSAAQIFWSLRYSRKRGVPTVTIPSTLQPLAAGGSNTAVISHTPSAIGLDSVRISTAVSSGFVAGNAVIFFASAASQIVISAEL